MEHPEPVFSIQYSMFSAQPVAVCPFSLLIVCHGRLGLGEMTLLQKGCSMFCIVGATVGSLWFGLCCWLSTVPPASDVSLSLALRPWWSNWRSALFFPLLTGLPVGFLASVRPDFRDSKQNGKT